MLCVQPCKKMAPPPWELSVMPRPSMLDGLHQKLLGNGLALPGALPPPPLLPPPLPPPLLQSAVVRSVVPVGIPPSAVVPNPKGSDPAGNLTPFASTVMPAP